jgi:hypothetical protein
MTHDELAEFDRNLFALMRYAVEDDRTIEQLFYVDEVNKRWPEVYRILERECNERIAQSANQEER